MKFEDFTYAIRDGDEETVRRINGLFVGQLTPEELEAFERCIHDGVAQRSYQGAAGFLGLAKVALC